MKIEDLDTTGSPLSDMTPDITLIGAGLTAFDQLTTESRLLLRRARLVFYSRFNGDPTADIRALGSDAEVRDLEYDHYETGMYRPTMYRRMADQVLTEARDGGAGVVVLQPGSAVVVDTVSQHIIEDSPRQGLSVRVIAGVSCVEAVLADLGYDLVDGICIVTAQRLLLHRQRLSSSLASMIIQPGYYDTRWWIGAARSTPERFDLLQHHLQLSYPDTTPMVLVLAPIRSHVNRHQFWFRLGNLSRLYPFMSPFHTLFIPPLTRQAVDTAFEHRIESLEAALAHVEQGSANEVLLQDEHQWGNPAVAGLSEDLLDESRTLAAWWTSPGK